MPPSASSLLSGDDSRNETRLDVRGAGGGEGAGGLTVLDVVALLGDDETRLSLGD